MEPAMAAARLEATCCVVGGGPAGMMLGLLLARAGIDVVVLEKHNDFFRDFRGDTIHPSTLELIRELGLLDQFLLLPHRQISQLQGQIGDQTITIADFSHLPTTCKFIAMMPQWDFLSFLAKHAGGYPGFRLHMNCEASDLLEERGRIVGCRARSPAGELDIRASLVVGADGRHSTIRDRAALAVEDLGAPMDVFWMRISRRADDRSAALGRIEAGHVFVMLDRGDYWQCAFVIPKGAAEEVRGRGLEHFRKMVLNLSPWLGERVDELASWDDIKLLTVSVNRLNQWAKPGLLCIGDAAHAMSPVGGVGINLAIQDAVATANILALPLREARVDIDLLNAVQRRRQWPTRVTQAIQVAIQNRIIHPVLTTTERPKPPLPLRLLDRFPVLRRIPARLIGIGVRPEHVQTPDVLASKAGNSIG
jgi:2-polyprenyl-6-methoxyphenol hydroxylase-like FAD-dependent oxidoreductase